MEKEDVPWGGLILGIGGVAIVVGSAWWLLSQQANDEGAQQRCEAQGGTWVAGKCYLPPPPNGNGPPPGDCDVYTPYTVPWCRCKLGEAESYRLAELRVNSPILLSLLSAVPDFPRNPEQYLIIETFDGCGEPLPGVAIWLKQSTSEWGGFVIPGYQNVNCGNGLGGEVYVGKTDVNGIKRVRYLCHHNPGPGVAQSVQIYIKATGPNLINGTSLLTVNGTNPAWPYDPFMITQERFKHGWSWYDCVHY